MSKFIVNQGQKTRRISKILTEAFLAFPNRLITLFMDIVVGSFRILSLNGTMTEDFRG